MKDEQFMRIEIEEAKKGTFPFGAVIVKGEEVIAKGHNLVEENDPTAHGEIGAIRNACKVLRTMSFAGCTLYTTCEPCAMCFMAAWWAQISKIVWGLGGQDVPEDDWKVNLDCFYLNKKSGNKIELVLGILKKECFELFK